MGAFTGEWTARDQADHRRLLYYIIIVIIIIIICCCCCCCFPSFLFHFSRPPTFRTWRWVTPWSATPSDAASTVRRMRRAGDEWIWMSWLHGFFFIIIIIREYIYKTISILLCRNFYKAQSSGNVQLHFAYNYTLHGTGLFSGPKHDGPSRSAMAW